MPLFNIYPFTCPARKGLTVATLLMAELYGSLAYGPAKKPVETNSARILGIRLPQQPNSVQKYLMSVGILPKPASCHPFGILNFEIGSQIFGIFVNP